MTQCMSVIDSSNTRMTQYRSDSNNSNRKLVVKKLVIQRICLMVFKCSIEVLSLPVSVLFNIILLFILITLKEVKLSTHL